MQGMQGDASRLEPNTASKEWIFDCTLMALTSVLFTGNKLLLVHMKLRLLPET